MCVELRSRVWANLLGYVSLFTQRKNVRSAFLPVDGPVRIFHFSAEENDSNRSGSRIFSATARKKYSSVSAEGGIELGWLD